jgi:glycosyltransferase involved in cell wall biosynthesis
MYVLFTFSDSYLPGYKAGGPIQTLVNMVDSLADEYSFNIVTRDRDLGDGCPYPGIKQNEWNSIGQALVYYFAPEAYSNSNLRRVINQTFHDLIYLNSFFSWGFTIKPLLLRRIGLIPKNTPLVLAPRGEFSTGALKLKSFKKKTYIALAKLLGLYNHFVWQASSQYEKEDILRVMGKDADVFVAPDLPAPIKLDSSFTISNPKKTGSIKCVFLSRISPKKNLRGALATLEGIEGQVELDIYGPLEDMNYWQDCQKVIHNLPNNISVNYKGLIAHDEVARAFAEHHLFLFPTLGENFGHVIIESLVAGCPVLLSDQTPWRNLAQEGVGWDLPLDRSEPFQEVVQRCVDMGEDEFRQLSQRANAYGVERSNDEEVLDANRNLFRYAIDKMQKSN